MLVTSIEKEICHLGKFCVLFLQEGILTNEKSVELAGLLEIGGHGQSSSKRKKAYEITQPKINHSEVDEMRVVCFPGNYGLVAACTL